MESDRRTRAEERRRRAIISKVGLGGLQPDLSPLRGAAAVSLVARLTAESWSLTGREMPAYSRSTTPYRFLRGFGE